MYKASVIGIILLVAGFIVAGVGSYAGAKCNNAFLFPACESGPHAYTVGIGGLVIMMVGIYFVTYVHVK